MHALRSSDRPLIRESPREAAGPWALCPCAIKDRPVYDSAEMAPRGAAGLQQHRHFAFRAGLGSGGARPARREPANYAWSGLATAVGLVPAEMAGRAGAALAHIPVNTAAWTIARRSPALLARGGGASAMAAPPARTGSAGGCAASWRYPGARTPGGSAPRGFPGPPASRKTRPPGRRRTAATPRPRGRQTGRSALPIASG